MRRAFCLIRPQPCYRRDAFAEGLRRAGFDVRGAPPTRVDPGDVILMWNRYGENHDLACRVEKQGGIVLVAENGYMGPGGVSPHAMEPRQWYALAAGGHNGSGAWAAGGPERWDALGVEIKPWRTTGEHIVVCPNRHFGRPDLIMPLGWAADVKQRLQAATGREVRVRPHPGNDQPKTPLADDLRNAWACAIWGSSAGVHALIAGIPVISAAPRWICKGAAVTGVGALMHHPMPHDIWESARRFALERLAWAQWHVDEIATGEPIARVVEHAGAEAAAA